MNVKAKSPLKKKKKEREKYKYQTSYYTDVVKLIGKYFICHTQHVFFSIYLHFKGLIDFNY